MKSLILSVLSLFVLVENFAQRASIREEQLNMKTYMFSEPDPVPKMGPIYPYFRFDGYTNTAIDKPWKMVILENDYIKVYVCPDIGGKVWGAIEKSTGKEFLYYNHVVKFRDVAMRGAWTSGGLEFNFGDIGHIPTCATPVDYLTAEHPDGSVSCYVGALDIPSQTRWNIEIKLSPGKAYFETIVSWFNPTQLPCTYYHWMNAAAKAGGNLEFIYPGINYIGHGGEAGNWPIENGKNLSIYAENNFGPYKSYHVMNAYSDYFGGYWHDDNFGFGHYASYDDKPGKKLWIWGLSDQGMIWEDLLTDADGQYIEYQAGKLFNQAAPNSSFTPFKHKEFSPYDSDIMQEMWFPLKETKGMVAVSEYAILNIEEAEDSLTVYISALQVVNDSLIIELGDRRIKQLIDLEPLQLHTLSIENKRDASLKIVLGANLLSFSSRDVNKLDGRPILPNQDFDWKSAYGLYTTALELEKQRMYTEAFQAYQKCLQNDPGFLPAINRMAMLSYRRMEYPKALEYCKKALAIDTYDADANYTYGLVNNILGNKGEAKSGFSIASHSILKRSAAHVELAKMFLADGNYTRAQLYAEKALENNSNSIAAYEVMAYSYRKQNKPGKAQAAIKEVYALDALSDFARFEELQLNQLSVDDLQGKITNELAHESYLTLAMTYLHFNDSKAALEVLRLSPGHPLVQLWTAYLANSVDDESMRQLLSASAEMVFPHRNETGSMLETLLKTRSDWQLKYYLGLIYWKNGRDEEARELFLQCQDKPGFAAFYLARAELFKADSAWVKNSLEKAYELGPEDWRAALELSKLYLEKNETKAAINTAEKFTKRYPEIPSLGLTYAKALLQDKQDKTCLSFLNNWTVLPYEGSIEGKKIYTRTCLNLAMDALASKRYKKAIDYAQQAKDWPRNLGVGKPYDVDERFENFIIAISHGPEEENTYYSRVANHKPSKHLNENSCVLLQAIALNKTQGGDEGLDLLKKVSNENPANVYVQWALEKYNNTPKAEQIQQDILLGNDRDKTEKDEYFELVIKLVNSI